MLGDVGDEQGRGFSHERSMQVDRALLETGSLCFWLELRLLGPGVGKGV